MNRNVVNVCKICDTEEEADDFHKNSPLHRFNFALENYHKNKEALRGNRHGIELAVEVVPLNGFEYDFTVTPDKKGCYFLNITPEKFKSHRNQIEFKCKIKNGRKRNEDPLVITYRGVLHPYKSFSMADPNNNLEQHARGAQPFVQQSFIPLQPGTTYEVIVKLSLEESHVSNFRIPVYFSFQTVNKEKMQSFSIARSIIVQIHNELWQEVQVGKSPFTNNKWDKVNTVVPARKNFRAGNDQFPIPKKYFKTLASGLKKDFDGVLQHILAKLHPGYLTMDNYNEYFHILLWLEETCSIIGLSCYNMENVKLVYRKGDILVLEVPGLAEKRPSVVKGDEIEIKIHGDHKSYKGVIQKVEDKTVDIHFLDHFIVDVVQYSPQMEMDVRFVLGRIHFERMHQGIEQVVQNGFVKSLFPKDNLSTRRVYEPIVISENELFNKTIYANGEQMTAVMKIVNNTSKGAPYIVYGPPGTGKTITIVEAIYHLKRLTKQKILVCAPANAACNMLTEKLAAFCTPKELKRVMSENCDTSTIHDSIVKYCNIYCDEGEKVVLPFPKTDLIKYRIIVTTLVLAGKYTREHHPDIVFIDEAAQAREPEACCAIGLLSKNKRLILAGDPKQLGPVVHSTICLEYKYAISLLERLMDLPVYENDTEHNFITMLKMNFRSHSDILTLPNKLFYNMQLQAVSASALGDPLAKIFVYKLIVGAKQNIVNGAAIEFCSVLAKEKREGRSPSYYNPREAQMVKKYVEALTSIAFDDDQSLTVTPDQIGIVTPYIRQMCKIREALRGQFEEVEVGTTEAFQGREKRVMIISTVRAQEDLLLYDRMYKLGFVGEAKRFNVAITRAKSKVIVIGNPLVLSLDSKWREFIDQARSHGTFCGAPYQERTQRLREDISSRLSKVKLKN